MCNGLVVRDLGFQSKGQELKSSRGLQGHLTLSAFSGQK